MRSGKPNSVTAEPALAHGRKNEKTAQMASATQREHDRPLCDRFAAFLVHPASLDFRSSALRH